MLDFQVGYGLLKLMNGVVDRMTELASEHEWELLRKLVLEDLLEGGRCINARDAEGRTVLLAAVQALAYSDGSWAVESVRMLLAAGARRDLRETSWGRTPLEYAEELGKDAIVALLRG